MTLMRAFYLNPISLFRVLSALQWNMDETMVAADTRKLRVIVPTDFKKPVVIGDRQLDEHITVLLCICADKTHMPPMFILQQKTITAELTAV